jgi:hypothetical protein
VIANSAQGFCFSLKKLFCHFEQGRVVSRGTQLFDDAPGFAGKREIDCGKGCPKSPFA